MTAHDGAHTLTARAYDSGGQEKISAGVPVNVRNTTGTQYQASYDLNQLGPSDDPFAIPPTILSNELATPIDPYSGSTTNRTLPSEPVDSSAEYSWSPDSTAASKADGSVQPNLVLIPPPEDPKSASAFQCEVTVTNNSPVAWKGNDLQLWYRWYTTDGVILFEGPGNEYFPQTVQPGQSKRIPITVEPPAVPSGIDLTQVRLRFDIHDYGSTAANKWFAGRGNRPVDNPVIVNKELEGNLGLERFWHYDAEQVGAGMSTLTNVANGNMLLRWSPFFAPGRGLATMVDLTYNAMEDHSESPAGNNFSLSISGLSRFGNPIDIHPNNADLISGKSRKYVVLTDGDGTTHEFKGVTGTDGITRWTEPPGVNLYLRSIATNPADRRWALTRPDKVTFYYDVDGFPTAVVDRNGNTLAFTLEATPPGEDPGGPKKRVTRVTDAAGRAFVLDYYSKDEAKKAHVRGKVQRITDHSGSALDFEYYDDGNLLRITQRGGTKANGEFLADRSFVFTYTTSNGAGPAIPDPAARVDPDPRTPNQSTRLFSVRDPRGVEGAGHETTFDYYGPSEGAQLRWKLQSRTNRTGDTTAFSYDIVQRITTVSAPEQRTAAYTYDTGGKVTRIVNPLGEPTTVTWSPDLKVTKVTEPTTKFTTYTYNANGYLTSQTSQKNETTQLTYLDSAVDGNDTGNHLSLLSTVTRPKGVATPTIPDDYQTRFSYDSAGNVDKVTDPTGAISDYDFNLAGSAAPGTVAAMRDANGNPATTFPSYDPSGQPTEIRDPLGGVTRFAYTADGRVRSIQDPNHASVTGTDERAYRIFLDYDSFHRLGRQSAPKSTVTDRGRVIWAGVDFDAGDNIVTRFDPHYGTATDDGEGGPTSTASYDHMDRPLVVSNSDKSVDPAGERTRYEYDDAGRMVKVTYGKGVLSATVDDNTSVLTYDRLDRLIRQTAFGTGTTDKRVTHLCFDLAGDLRSVTSPRANLDAISCPATGLSFTARYDYDAAHRVITRTDPAGHATRLEYDANGNQVSTEEDIATGRVKKTTTGYDLRDKPVEVRKRFTGTRDVVTRVEYDRNGNRSRLISPRGFDAAQGSGTFTEYVTSFAYDALNHLTRVTLPFDSRDGAERQYVHRAYDGNGNVTWTSLPVTSAAAADVRDTARTLMSYFDPGWVRTSDDPNNPKVRFDYAAPGWQTSRVPERKDQPGVLNEDRRMSWEFFNDGQLRSRKDQGGQPSTYTYDANDKLVKALDAAGVTDPGEAAVETESSYTGFDEVAKVRHRKQGQTVWKFSDYTYDPNGNVTVRRENGEEDTAGTQTKAPRRHEFSYDTADWLTGQLDLGTDGACKDDQRIANAFWPTGWEKQRDVFRAGTGCSPDPATWPKKQTTTWTHFDNGKLDELVTKNGSGAITESHDVGYLDDAGVYVNGNRVTDHYVLKRREGSTANTCVAANPCDAEYEYDARDKLIRHQQRALKETTYKLDEQDKLIGDTTIRAGNITTENKNGQITTRKYTGSQLTELSIGPAVGKYWYDTLGNLDCVTLAGGSQGNCSPSDGGASSNLVVDYAYDYLNRLASTRAFSGGSTRTDKTDYTYDALDRTVKEVEDHADPAKDRTTDFAYQGLSGLVTEEKQAGGSNPKTKTFSYDSYGHRISMSDRNNATGVTETFTYSHDVHGSVSQLIDDTGQVKASYGYDAYGATDAPPGDPEALTTGDTDPQAPLNPYRYSGKRMDSGMATGTGNFGGYDMGARRYGPDTTRFIQEDIFNHALGDLGLTLDPLSQNRYALAGGNPVSYVEIDGHMVIADGGGGGTTTPTTTSTQESQQQTDEKSIWARISTVLGRIAIAADMVDKTMSDRKVRHSLAQQIRNAADDLDDLMDRLRATAKYADRTEDALRGLSRTISRHGDDIAKWTRRGGWALTAIGGVFTYADYRSQGQGVGEAAGRTGIDVGIGVGVGVGAGLLCGAVTFGAAAIACGAGASVAWEFLNEKFNITQKVGDFFFEGGVQRVADRVSEGFQNTVDGLRDFGSSAVETGQDVISGVGEELGDFGEDVGDTVTFWD
jgi:RHS repeat-associated protein